MELNITELICVRNTLRTFADWQKLAPSVNNLTHTEPDGTQCVVTMKSASTGFKATYEIGGKAATALADTAEAALHDLMVDVGLAMPALGISEQGPASMTMC